MDLVLGPGYQRALFTVLALRVGRAVSRASLVSAIWGEDPPDTVMSSLYTYVSRLRRELEPERSRRDGFDVLVSDGDGYLLRLPEESIDSFRFEDLRQQGRKAYDRGDVAEARARFDEALELWQGTALSGLPGPFAERQRQRLTDLRVDTVLWRAKAMLAANTQHEAVPDLAKLARDYPLREDLRALLMVTLYRSGRAAEAVEVFQDTLATLSAEAGTRPGPELYDLHRRILDNDPALGDPAVETEESPEPLPDPAPSSPSSPNVPTRRPRHRNDGFVGRQDEVGEIRRLARDVAAGRGALLWVDGQPGVGKTELLAAGLGDVEALGCQSYWGAATQLTQRLPLRMVLECLDFDPGRQPVTDVVRGPVSGGLVGLSDPTLSMIDDIASFVEQLCARSPVVLVLDDVHWADDATVLVALQLARLTSALPLLLVVVCGAAARPAQLDRLWQVARQSEHVMSIRGLPDDDVVDLVRHLLGARPGLRLWRCLTHVAGNPGDIRLIAETISRAELARHDGDVVDIPAEAEPQLHQLLSSIVVDRIKWLGRAVSQLVRWSSLLGDEFSVEDLAAVTGHPLAELVPLADLAMKADILVGKDDHLAFRDHLLRQAVYEDISPALRETLRREAADVLDRPRRR
jgi:DNA-binding SARP family transcriptional activator